jgi:hypothetical protein
LISAIAALVLWRVGRRLFGETVGAVAAALAWIWPPFDVYKLTHQWGFYASGVLYSALLLLLGLRLVERPSRVRVGTFGLVLGLAMWQNDQLTPVVVPLVAWAAWTLRRQLRDLWLAAPLAVLGALPAIVWNLRHDWGSFSSPIADTTSYQHRVRIFASPLLPMALGLRTPFSQQALVSSAFSDLVYAVLAALFLYGAYRARHSLAFVLYLIVAVYPLVYALAPQTLFSQEPRYLVVLTPILALLLAQLATSVPRAAVVLAVAAAVSVATLQRVDRWFETVPADPPMAPKDLRPLIAELNRLHVDRVYATFWTTYRLDFETRERIIATQSKLKGLRRVDGRAVAAHNPFARWEPYEYAVQKAPRNAFVLLRRELPLYPGVAQRLQSLGYRRYAAGSDYDVWAAPG